MAKRASFYCEALTGNNIFRTKFSAEHNKSSKNSLTVKNTKIILGIFDSK